MMPSPAPDVDSAMVTSAPAVSDFAVSASTLAGTSAAALTSVAPGSQPSSRSESRKRSVASSARSEPSISIRTPVSTGSMSSRPAAVTAWRDGVGEQVAAHGAGGLRHVGQRGVLLDRHGLQAEPGAAAGQGHLGAVDGHLDRLGRAGCGRCRRAGVRRPAPCPRRRPRPGRWRGRRSRSRTCSAAGRRRSSRSAGRRAPGRSDGPGGCGRPRRRRRPGRRARRGTSRVFASCGDSCGRGPGESRGDGVPAANHTSGVRGQG